MCAKLLHPLEYFRGRSWDCLTVLRICKLLAVLKCHFKNWTTLMFKWLPLVVGISLVFFLPEDRFEGANRYFVSFECLIHALKRIIKMPGMAMAGNNLNSRLTAFCFPYGIRPVSIKDLRIKDYGFT